MFVGISDSAGEAPEVVTRSRHCSPDDSFQPHHQLDHLRDS
jgi:hypothetical protein